MTCWMYWFSSCWSEGFSSCQRGFWTLKWILCSLGGLVLFIFLASIVLIDSSISERFSALFSIVWDFGPHFLPQILLWWRGMHRCFFSPLPCPYLSWMSLPYLDFHLILQVLSDEMAFLMHVLFLSDSGESVLTARKFSGWQVSKAKSDSTGEARRLKSLG